MTITLVVWTSVLTDVVVVVDVRASPAGVIGGDVNSSSLMDNAVWQYSSFLSTEDWVTSMPLLSSSSSSSAVGLAEATWAPTWSASSPDSVASFSSSSFSEEAPLSSDSS